MKKLLLIGFILSFLFQFTNVRALQSDGSLGNENVQGLIVNSIKLKKYIDKRFPESGYSYQKVAEISDLVLEKYEKYNDISELNQNDINMVDGDVQPLNYSNRLVSDSLNYMAQKLIEYTRDNGTDFELDHIKEKLSFSIDLYSLQNMPIMGISTFVCAKSDYRDGFVARSPLYVEKDGFALLQLEQGHCEAHGSSSTYVSYNSGITLEKINFSTHTVFTVGEIGIDSIELNAYKGWSYGVSGIFKNYLVEDLEKNCGECEIEFDKTIEIKFEEFKDYIVK